MPSTFSRQTSTMPDRIPKCPAVPFRISEKFTGRVAVDVGDSGRRIGGGWSLWIANAHGLHGFFGRRLPQCVCSKWDTKAAMAISKRRRVTLENREQFKVSLARMELVKVWKMPRGSIVDHSIGLSQSQHLLLFGLLRIWAAEISLVEGQLPRCFPYVIHMGCCVRTKSFHVIFTQK